MSKKILIVRLDRMGDVVLSTPVIKAIRGAYPESHIAMMVRTYSRDIVEGNPYLSEVIIYDKNGTHKGLIGNLRFIRELRNKKFDTVVVLHPTNRTHLILRLSGIPDRIGYDKKLGFLLTKKIPHTKQFGMKHEIAYNLDVLKYIGIEPKDSKLYMPVNSISERKITKLLTANGVNNSDLLVAINPGASCASKRWGIEKFAKAANGLVEKYGAKIIIISGDVDKHFGDGLALLIKNNCINLSGKTSIADTASVLRRVKLFISNDSGPVHVSCAIGTPVIAIFGRGDRGLSPKRWGPSGRSDIVLHKDAGCDICYAHNCRTGFKCLDSITPQEVLDAADQILGK